MAAASTPPRSPTTHLIPINDPQGSIPASVGKRIDSKVCGVCGDKALGYNFNAITCESCKAFFRRNALKKKEFRCPFNESCKVDQITRRFCQKCRLRKCFEIGMKKEWIMTEEEKQRKKQKIEENRARKFADDDSTSSVGTTLTNLNTIQAHINNNNNNNNNNTTSNTTITQPRPSHIIHQSPTPTSTHPSHSLPPLPPAHRYVDDDSTSSLSSTASSTSRPRQFSPVGQFCPFPASVVGVEPTKPQAVVVGVIRSEEDGGGVKVARLEGQSDVGQARHSSPAAPSPAPKSHGTPEDKDHLMLLGEEGGGGLASSSPLGSAGGGGGGGGGGTVGVVRVVDQGGSSSPHTPPANLDVTIKKEEVEFNEDSPSTPSQATTHGWQETSHRQEASQVVREAGPWGSEMLHDRENSTSHTLEEFQKELEVAGDRQEPPREPAVTVQHLDGLDTCQDHLQDLRSPPDTFQSHLRRPPDTPHTLDTPPLDTHHHHHHHLRQPPDTPHSLDTPPLDTHEQQQEYLETACGHMEAGAGGRQHHRGGEDNMGSGFSIREALNVLQPGCKDDSSSSLSISSIMDTAITAEYSSFTLLAGADPGALNQAEQVKLAELSEANKGLMAPLSEDYNFKDLNDPSLINVINLTEIAIRRLIKMAKRITAFKSLCQEDQIALLKGGCTEMMILRSLCAYDPDKDSWKIQEDHESFRSIQLKVLKSAPGNVYEEHKRFIDSFLPEWRRDPNIIFLLSAITLFSPQRPNIVHPPAILHEQCSYLYLLKRYLEGCYGWCEGRSVYHSLLQRLTHLHLLSENHIRVFLEVNPRQVEPLLIEIFDLKQR